MLASIFGVEKIPSPISAVVSRLLRGDNCNNDAAVQTKERNNSTTNRRVWRHVTAPDTRLTTLHPGLVADRPVEHPCHESGAHWPVRSAVAPMTTSSNSCYALVSHPPQTGPSRGQFPWPILALAPRRYIRDSIDSMIKRCARRRPGWRCISNLVTVADPRRQCARIKVGLNDACEQERVN